jgi:hypothetical protein
LHAVVTPCGRSSLKLRRRAKGKRSAEERYIIIAYMKAISRRKGCDMRYSDMELYGPRSGIYGHACTEGYSMATLLS